MPTPQDRKKSPAYVIVFCSVLLFIALLASSAFIPKLATTKPDAAHSIAINQHGTTYYLAHGLGEIYRYQGRILGGLLVVALVTGWLARAGKRNDQ